tara:strand:- start:239 stop:922 length:684 start_codon:yes stop_codon:yes gene_type:complete
MHAKYRSDLKVLWCKTSASLKVYPKYINHPSLHAAMAKQVVMFNLDDPLTKTIAESLTNESSRKLIQTLTEEELTPTELAKRLAVPLPTVHYNLEKLKKAGLIEEADFHYSEKGKKVLKYRVANKYILITPKETKGVMTKLRHILPVLVLGIGSGLIYLFEQGSRFGAGVESAALRNDLAQGALKEEIIHVADPMPSWEPNFALWFLIGGLVIIITYYIIEYVRRKK